MKKSILAIILAFLATSALSADGPRSAYSFGIGAGWAPMLDGNATTFLRDDLAEVSASFSIAGAGRVALEAVFELGYGFAIPGSELPALSRYRGGLGARIRISPSGRFAFGLGALVGAERLRYDALDPLGWYSKAEAFLEAPISGNAALGVSGGVAVWNDEISAEGIVASMPILGYVKFRL